MSGSAATCVEGLGLMLYKDAIPAPRAIFLQRRCARKVRSYIYGAGGAQIGLRGKRREFLAYLAAPAMRSPLPGYHH